MRPRFKPILSMPLVACKIGKEMVGGVEADPSKMKILPENGKERKGDLNKLPRYLLLCTLQLELIKYANLALKLERQTPEFSGML